MARARNIKPAFFMNETLVALPFEVRLLFIGLWTLADRDGRLEDRPQRIKMELFPADALDVDACLVALEQRGLIERYEAGGVKVVWVKNFKKHQSPHHSEKSSSLPDKEGVVGGEAQKEDQEAVPRDTVNGTVNLRKHDGRNRSDLLIPDSLNEDSLNVDLLSEGGGTPFAGMGEEKEEEKKALWKKETKNNQEANNASSQAAPPPKLSPSFGRRKKQISGDFALTEKDIVFAREQGVNVGHELAAFQSHHRAKGSLMQDWHAAWRTWCLNSVKFRQPMQTKNGAAPPVHKAAHKKSLNAKNYAKGAKADGTVAF